MPKLNIEELFVGGFIQLPFYFVIGLWVIPLAILSGLLWALGGAEDSSKLFRRLGVPFLAIFFLVASGWQSLLVLAAYPGAVLACSLGYGLESKIWRFFYRIRQNHKAADFVTRLLTYSLYWISFGSVLVFIQK